VLTVICSLSDEKIYNQMLLPSLKRTDEILSFVGLPLLDIVTISGNESIFRNYNLGISRARYPIKAFIHQDVDLLHPSWVFKVIRAFASCPNTGLIGLVGTSKLLDRGMWWESGREYIYGEVFSGLEKANWIFNVSDSSVDVQCVDGLFMATNRDIPWDSSLKGFHCYDIDYSREISQRGLGIKVIPHKVWHIGAIRDGKPDMEQFYTKWENDNRRQ